MTDPAPRPGNSALDAELAPYLTNENMAAHDRLPRELRRALDRADHQWSAAQMEDLLARRGLDYVLDTIAANDWKHRYSWAPELQRDLRGPLRLRRRR
jgi:hypothetical protein